MSQQQNDCQAPTVPSCQSIHLLLVNEYINKNETLWFGPFCQCLSNHVSSVLGVLSSFGQLLIERSIVFGKLLWKFTMENLAQAQSKVLNPEQ